MVMLSLFIGAVTMSMAQSMQEMKLALEDAKRKKRMKRAMKRSQSKAASIASLRPAPVGKVRGWMGGKWQKVLRETADAQEIIRISDIMRMAFEDTKAQGAAKKKMLGKWDKKVTPGEGGATSDGVDDDKEEEEEDEGEGQAFGVVLRAAMAYTRLASK